MTKFNKATAAAVVVVLSWLLSLGGVELPQEAAGAFIVLLVWAVPNVEAATADPTGETTPSE